MSYIHVYRLVNEAAATPEKLRIDLYFYIYIFFLGGGGLSSYVFFMNCNIFCYFDKTYNIHVQMLIYLDR